MYTMVSVAMLYLLILEPYLAIKLDEISPTSPVSITDRAMSFFGGEKKFVKFYLFTRRKGKEGRALNLEDHESFEDFDPSLETKVIIHGFLDQVRIADWMHSMKDEFLIHGDYNVIVVDWSSGNSIPYSQAAANTEQVGLEISQMLAFLRENFGARTETFHLIGHSLGSHVAGFVGENIKPIGRITGLDPAMYHFKDASPRKRLDTSDANFVDAIHTDAGGIGMVKPVGHVDFYPNGGSVQPGCTAINYVTSLLEKGVVESVRSLICSHMRAILLFTESINSPICQMSSSQCSSWSDYEGGKCGDCGSNGEKCAIMGFHTDVTRNYGNHSYYLLTAANPPYCVFEYRLKIVEAGEPQEPLMLPQFIARDKKNKQKFWVTLLGNKGETEFLVDERNEYSHHSYVVASPIPLGFIDGAILKWKPKPLNRAVEVISRLIRQSKTIPLITRIEVVPVNMTPETSQKFVLCASPSSLDSQNSIVGLRSIYC